MFQWSANAILQLRLINDLVSTNPLGIHALVRLPCRNKFVLAYDFPVTPGMSCYRSGSHRALVALNCEAK
jgi:hypothetical protein